MSSTFLFLIYQNSQSDQELTSLGSFLYFNTTSHRIVYCFQCDCPITYRELVYGAGVSESNDILADLSSKRVLPWHKQFYECPCFLAFLTAQVLSFFLKIIAWGSPAGSDVKESACNVGAWVRSLGQEDLMEKGRATHSSILAWRIAWTEEPGRLQSMGL